MTIITVSNWLFEMVIKKNELIRNRLLSLSHEVMHLCEQIDLDLLASLETVSSQHDEGFFFPKIESVEVSKPPSEYPDRKIRRAQADIPDSRFLRNLIDQREHRKAYFDAELVVDPIWNMLLDLTLARAELRRVSITSLCIASGVPSTTALRYIGIMGEKGMTARTPDTMDARRTWISISDKGATAMAKYFEDLAEQKFRRV